jgi:hypothetical protein
MILFCGMNKIITILLLCFLPFAMQAQDRSDSVHLQENVKQYHEVIDSLYNLHIHNGLTLVKDNKLPMHDGIETVMHIPLMAGDAYHFVFVGDPDSRKIKLTLFKEGQGDYIQDKIMVKQDGVFWSQFSFACPETGDYELTLYQRSAQPNPLSYLMLFKHPKKVAPAINKR